MKKFLLALFVSLPFLSMAQSLKLSDFKIVNEDGLFKATAAVTNTSGASIEVRVKRTVESLAIGHSAYFCWVSCYGPNTDVSPDGKVIKAGETNASSFYGDIETSGKPGSGNKISYCFFDYKNPSDQTCYTFDYDQLTGIATVYVDDAVVLTTIAPNPVLSTGKISYDLTGKHFNEANLVVRNLVGAVVKTIRLTQISDVVSVNADQLGSGIYMYSLVLDGKAILTRKMTVAN